MPDDSSNAGASGESTGAASVLAAFEGPHTVGRSRGFWVGFALVVLVAFALPLFTNAYRVILYTTFLIWVLLALSLTFVWGYAGVFSLSQTAFFGIGGYAFGIVGTNLVDVTGATNVAFLAAVIAPVVLAALLGYFMFYGRVGGVYVGLVTLSVTLILGLLFTRTSGVSVGAAKLGGLTGMTTIPTLAFGYGATALSFGPAAMYYLVVVAVLLVYLALRYLLNGDFGYAVVAMREDEERTELFGYNVKRTKLVAFAAGAGLAGASGALYAASNGFINPDSMGLTAAALPIIWVTVGGRKTLLGAVSGALALQYLSQKISQFGSGFSLILLGFVVVAVILYFPSGVVPTLRRELRARRSATSADAGSAAGDGGDRS